MKTVLITGASSGLGSELYNYFSSDKDEYSVYGVSRRGPDIKIDLANLSSLPALFEEAIVPDILINNAGMLSFDEMSDYQKIVNVNFLSVWKMLEHYSNIMTDGGIIINIASISGVKGEADIPLYAATKAGIINLTKSYAKKLVSKNIRVNCISPGFMKTNLVEGETPKEMVDGIPMKRESEVEEYVSVVKMILDCEYITGQNLIIDGGLDIK